MSDKKELAEIFGMPVMLDESIPINDFQFNHPDGRIDRFMVLEGEVLPIQVTKLGDKPSWICVRCASPNTSKDKTCQTCSEVR